MSDTGGGVPFRRIENLFSYMYSTAPAPQIGEHARTPLVSRRAALLHSYMHWKADRSVKITQNAAYAIWLHFCAADQPPVDLHSV